MGRRGEMHEPITLAVFLLAPGAIWINGQTIAIDGAGCQAPGGSFRQTLSPLDDAAWERVRATLKGSNARDRSQRTS